MQEENKQLKCEVKSLQESTEFQNETYEKMKNDMKEEKQKIEADYRNNLNSENTKIKEQIAELEDRHRRNNLQFMGI